MSEARTYLGVYQQAKHPFFDTLSFASAGVAALTRMFFSMPVEIMYLFAGPHATIPADSTTFRIARFPTLDSAVPEAVSELVQLFGRTTEFQVTIGNITPFVVQPGQSFAFEVVDTEAALVPLIAVGYRTMPYQNRANLLDQSGSVVPLTERPLALIYDASAGAVANP